MLGNIGRKVSIIRLLGLDGRGRLLDKNGMLGRSRCRWRMEGLTGLGWMLEILFAVYWQSAYRK